MKDREFGWCGDERSVRGARLVAAVIVCLGALLVPQLAHAVTIVVNTSVDEYDTVANNKCSLREAFKAAQSNAAFGGCIAGEPNLNDQIQLTTSVTLTRDTPIVVFSTISVWSVWPQRYTITGRRSGFSVQNGGNLALSRLSRLKLTGYTLLPLEVKAWQVGGAIGRPYVSLSEVEFSNNDVGNLSNAAAITVGAGSELFVTRGVFYRNTSSIRGGAIFNNGSASFRETTFAENSANQSGGAITNYGSMKLINVTISGNKLISSVGEGTGIYNLTGATLEMWHSTVAGNFSAVANASPKAVTNLGTFKAWTSVIADNSGGLDCSGSFTSLGYNLVGDCSGFTAAGDQSGKASVGLAAMNAISPGWSVPPVRRGTAGAKVLNYVPWATCNSSVYIDSSNWYDPTGFYRPDDNACDVGAAESSF